jgi:N,N'-diacetylchitobiose non-reducing end deacetylase
MAGFLGIEIPDIRKAKRILAVQPHYDDNDISAGGMLATLAEGGAELHYLTVTNDLAGVIDVTWTPEEATRRLRDDQDRAGQIMGVKSQAWLGYPDAGKYDYFDVRRDIIKHIRMVQPDVIVSIDPWMLYESHNDHILAGKATAEAVILHDFMRIETDREVDRAYRPHPLQAVVFYNTSFPNTVFDITPVVEKKKAAMRCYKAQFREEDFEHLLWRVNGYNRYLAREQDFEYGEAIKIMSPSLLHSVGEAIRF